MKTALALLTAIGVAMTLGNQAAAELNVGDPAPDFELTGSDGKTYKLSDFKDKQAVVVAWFPRAFTGGCTAECQSMRESGDLIRKFDVAYFTASCDAVELNTRFAESLELDYPILSDPTAETARAYGLVSGNRTAASRWTFYIGKDGNIAYIDKSVNTRTAGPDIAARLEALGVAQQQE